MGVRFQGGPIEEQPVKATLILAVAALTIGACSYRTETVERRAPSGPAIVTETAAVNTPDLLIPQ